MSLCVKRDSAGNFYVDNTDYNLNDVMMQYPEFVNEKDLRFRSKEHFAYRVFTKNVVDSKVKPAAIEGLQRSILDTAQQALGNKLTSTNVSDYAMTFYKKSAQEEAAKHRLEIPKNGIHVMVSKKDMATEYGLMLAKHKKLQPHLTSASAAKVPKFESGKYEFALNFVESASKQGKCGYYIEQFTSDNKYELTAHRLPPEINKTTIFTQTLIDLCDPVLLRSDPTFLDEVRDIARTLKIVDGNIDITALTPEQLNLMRELLLDKTDPLGSTTQKLLENYAAATTTQVNGLTLPSVAYLKFAEKQCQSFRLSQGNVPICILPRDHEDPLLIQAYALVCEAKGWVYQDNSRYTEAHPRLGPPWPPQDEATRTAVQQLGITFSPHDDVHLDIAASQPFNSNAPHA